MSMVYLKGSGGSVSWNGMQFNATVDGVIGVPPAAAEELKAHGFVVVPPPDGVGQQAYLLGNRSTPTPVDMDLTEAPDHVMGLWAERHLGEDRMRGVLRAALQGAQQSILSGDMESIFVPPVVPEAAKASPDDAIDEPPPPAPDLSTPEGRLAAAGSIDEDTASVEQCIAWLQTATGNPVHSAMKPSNMVLKIKKLKTGDQA